MDIDNDGDLDPSPALNVMVFLGQVAIWSIVFLVTLANLGVNITGLLAGLGIGGIAVALAVQAILGDLLSSLSIALDKPFMVDDLLRVNDIEGRVEYVGVRSTRLRSVNGEQIIWPNGDLSKSRIHNLGRMSERRVVSRLHIQYEATPEQVGTGVEAGGGCGARPAGGAFRQLPAGPAGQLCAGIRADLFRALWRPDRVAASCRCRQSRHPSAADGRRH